jgi:hypothetical protein
MLIGGLHEANKVFPAHLNPPRLPNVSEQFAILQAAIYLLLSGIMLSAIMLLAGQNRRLVHVMVAALALTDPLLWMAMFWVMGRGSLVEGLQACLVRGEWSAQLRGMFLGPAVTFSIKIAYLVGLLGRDEAV